MLPFLPKIKVRDNSEIINRTPDQDKEPEENQGLEACARSLISAVESKDVAAAAQALKDAFSICQSEPDYSEEDNS